MSESEAAAGRGEEDEEDCPLCLEPLPPFWDSDRQIFMPCCAKRICIDCRDKKTALVKRAIAEGSYGKEEEQLKSCCPLCRTKVTNYMKLMNDKFEQGQLPLRLFRDLGWYSLKRDHGVGRNAEKGMEILVLGAERGDPNCQYSIGLAYYEGSHGMAKSPTDAKRWLLAAAKQGHAIAEFNLALMLKVEGNDPGFLRHLRSSASKGCDSAYYNLGCAHYNGECGLPRSMKEATRALTPAAERGYTQAMSLLGWILCTDDHGQVLQYNNPNFTKGVHWLRRASKKGGEKAVKDLGLIEKWASSLCFRCYNKAPPAKAFLRCSRCRAAWYCSKDCQTRHWKAAEGGHKQYCIKWG